MLQGMENMTVSEFIIEWNKKTRKSQSNLLKIGKLVNRNDDKIRELENNCREMDSVFHNILREHNYSSNETVKFDLELDKLINHQKKLNMDFEKLLSNRSITVKKDKNDLIYRGRELVSRLKFYSFEVDRVVRELELSLGYRVNDADKIDVSINKTLNMIYNKVLTLQQRLVS